MAGGAKSAKTTRVERFSNFALSKVDEIERKFPVNEVGNGMWRRSMRFMFTVGLGTSTITAQHYFRANHHIPVEEGLLLSPPWTRRSSEQAPLESSSQESRHEILPLSRDPWSCVLGKQPNAICFCRFGGGCQIGKNKSC